MLRPIRLALLGTAFLTSTLALAADSRREAALVPADTAGGGGFSIPASWAGVWTYQNQTKDCVTGMVLNSSAYTDTTCAGEVVIPGGGFYQCTGGYDGSTYTSDCVASQQIFAGCRADYHLVQTGTRNGDTFTSTARSTTTFTGEACGNLANQCFDFVTTATRIAPAPNPCMVPVEPVSWGSLKARFR
jgi:hypothetical protein